MSLGACYNTKFGSAVENNVCAENVTQTTCVGFGGTFFPNQPCTALGFPWSCPRHNTPQGSTVLPGVDFYADNWPGINEEVNGWVCNLIPACTQSQYTSGSKKPCACYFVDTTTTGNEPTRRISFGACPPGEVCSSEYSCVPSSGSPGSCDPSKDPTTTCGAHQICSPQGTCEGEIPCVARDKPERSEPDRAVHCPAGSHCDTSVSLCANGCTSDADCTDGSKPTCSKLGICVKAACDPSGNSSTLSPCDEGKTCVDYSCVQACSDGGTTAGCPSGQACAAHEPFVCGKTCSKMTDCDPDQFCDGGACKAGCRYSSQCVQTGHVCRSGACMPACGSGKPACPKDTYCDGSYCNPYAAKPATGRTSSDPLTHLSVWAWVGIGLGAVAIIAIIGFMVHKQASKVAAAQDAAAQNSLNVAMPGTNG